MSWGTMSNGRLSMADISFRKTGNVSSLSDILEVNPAGKYFLSETLTRRLILGAGQKKAAASRPHIVLMQTTGKG